MRDNIRDIIAWYWLAVKWEARDFWNMLPGPWWVKIILIVVTQLIPGQIDDVVLIAVISLWRWYKRKEKADGN